MPVKEKAKPAAKAAPAAAPAKTALVQASGPEPVTFKDSRGVTQKYDTTHDMTKDGALNVDVPGPDDRKILK